MQGTLPVDENGRPLMNCMIWLDARAEQQAREATRGWPRIEGYGALRLLHWLHLANGVPNLSGKDFIAKLLWIRNMRPEIWERTEKLLDAKDYLLHRSTGRFVTTHDCGNLTWLMDTRAGRLCWSERLLRMLDITAEKLPDLISGTEIAGELTHQAAADLGLVPGIPVVGGAGDTVAMAVGAGAVRNHEFHLAIGTSAWVATHVPKRKCDVRSYIASICSAHPSKQLLVAHQETGGACVEWARRWIAGNGEAPTYKEVDTLVEGYEPGAKNLLFLPWLSGEYAPVDDPWARGAFMNLSLDHELGHMLRAIFEGVALNARWALGKVEKLIGEPAEALRFAGGGAASHVWSQILADVLDRPIIQLDRPQLTAARGAGMIAAHALGMVAEFDDIGGILTGRARYEPRPELRSLYDEKFELFTDFYQRNRSFFRRANQGP
jgi:xylulokinase